MDRAPGVCFFGSASDKASDAMKAAAAAFGTACASHGWRFVYGGSRRGLMAAAAAGAMAAGGTVLGVMPKSLVARELADPTITKLHVVDTLSERKRLMAELADAFVSFPGGIGTLDELAEMITWHDLGVHGKHSYLVNLDGFWDPLLAQLERFGREQMLRGSLDARLSVVPDVGALVAALAGRFATDDRPQPRNAG